MGEACRPCSPEGRRLAFVPVRDGRSQVMAPDLDDGTAPSLTGLAGVAFNPARPHR